MNNRSIFALSLVVILSSTPVLAQMADENTVPPENAMKVSEIVAKIEARADFRFLDELDWDDDGYYEIIYFTNDKAKVEMKINPVTGEPI